MSAKPTSPEQCESILKTILTIEANGGSVGYKSNPELFQDFAVEVYACATEEDLVIECLEELKTMNGLGDSAKNMKVLESYMGSHGDEDVRGLLPKFKLLKSNMQDLHAFDSLIKDVRALSELRKGTKTGVNQRVLQTIESMEALGGSAGFQKHVSETQATAGEVTEQAISEVTEQVISEVTEQAISEAAKGADDSWCNHWGSVSIAAVLCVAIIDVNCDDVCASGSAWGLGIGSLKAWGWLHHAPSSVINGSKTTIKLEARAAVVGEIAGWFTRKTDDELMATFVGGGVGLSYALAVTGSVNWKKQ